MNNLLKVISTLKPSRFNTILQLLSQLMTVICANFEVSNATHIGRYNHVPLTLSSISGPELTTNTTQVHKHIVIVTVQEPPFTMKRIVQDSNGNNKTEWYGYCVDFFTELIKHLPYNVSYEIYEVPDGMFGSKIKVLIPEPVNPSLNTNATNYRQEEKWNGIIDELMSGRADLALAPMAVMAERELVIDFTIPFYDLVGIQILLKRPEVPKDWFKFLTVLDNEVWFSILVAYFVTSFIIFLFDRLSPYSHKNMARIKKSRQQRRDLEASQYTNSTFNGTSSIKTISNSQSINQNFKHPLAKSHQLGIGSMIMQKEPDMRRKSIIPGLDYITSKLHSSVHPGGAFYSDHHRFGHPRGSTTFSDYMRGINLRRSFGSTGNESDIEDDVSENSDIEDGKPDFGLRDSLWFCITSLTPQGGGEAPQNLSGRVVAGSWWLFCFIIIASYTANLAAFLTVSRLDIPIDSLDDLAKQYRIKYAPIDNSAEQTYFERMAYIEEIFYNIWKDMSLNDSLSEEERAKFAVWDYPITDKYTKIWAQIQQTGMPKDLDSAIKRVKKSTLDEGFALLASANQVKHAVMTDCSLKAVGDEFSRKPIALGVRKDDEKLRDDLSYATLQLINQRFMEVLREKWWSNNPDKQVCDNNDESEGIGLENIGGVFIIIIAGVILSFIAWAIERFMYKTKLWATEALVSQ